MELNEKLLKLRKEKNYSQSQLASKLKVSRQTISKWENGFAIPDSDNLINIANFFNININDLISKENGEKTSYILPSTKKHTYTLNKKIVFLFFTIIILIFIVYLMLAINRYFILTKIADNYVYKQIPNKNSFYYSYTSSNINTVTHEKSYYSEESYSNNNILLKEYYSMDFNINKKSNDINLIKIEYREPNNYYSIDTLNRTYTKSEYDQGTQFYYNLTASTLDAKITDIYGDITTFKNKLYLALNFNYTIKYVKNDDSNNFYLIQNNSLDDSYILTTSSNPANYFITLDITNTNNTLNESQTISYYFSKNSNEIDKKISSFSLNLYNEKTN